MVRFTAITICEREILKFLLSFNGLNLLDWLIRIVINVLRCLVPKLAHYYFNFSWHTTYVCNKDWTTLFHLFYLICHMLDDFLSRNNLDELIHPNNNAYSLMILQPSSQPLPNLCRFTEVTLVSVFWRGWGICNEYTYWWH